MEHGTPRQLPKKEENDSTKLRIRVAELMRWKFVVHPTTGIGGYWERGTQGRKGYERGDWGSRELAVGLPAYDSDLNACHEFEETLTEWQDREYQTILVRETCCRSHRATAEQRCRAFIAVMEKQDSGEPDLTVEESVTRDTTLAQQAH